VIDGGHKNNGASETGEENSFLRDQKLNVYMKNQLDLQQAEWENYENVVNKLLGQLDLADSRIHDLSNERHRLLEREEKYKIRIKLLERSYDQIKQVQSLLFHFAFIDSLSLSLCSSMMTRRSSAKIFRGKCREKIGLSLG
jgi:predicted nuclease with TOPRIM domain